MLKEEHCYIGTSGWIYQDWEGKFYPEDISDSEKLEYFAKYFNTTEINYSFYHLPRKQTFESWYERTPAFFVFSVKVSRFITHIKRMKEIDKAWEKFFQNASLLKEKLGPFLFQFPPSFKMDEENLKRIKAFLKDFAKENIKIAFEFRHKSWFDEEFYRLLKRFNVSWVIADSSRYPKEIVSTANFVYVRFHGPKSLFSSSYSFSQLKKWASLLKKYLLERKNIYVYFNNDFNAFAVKNAQTLKKLLSC